MTLLYSPSLVKITWVFVCPGKQPTLFVLWLISILSASCLRAMWGDLVSKKSSLGGNVWCVLGYFNSVCASIERVRGVRFSSIATNLDCFVFNNFISQMELIGLTLLGRKFTWFLSNVAALITLDRILVSDSCFRSLKPNGLKRVILILSSFMLA